MDALRFFVEGVDDIRFVEDISFFMSGMTLTKSNLVNVGGCTFELVTEKQNLFKENSTKGGTNIILFDANGSFSAKQTEILSYKQKLDIEFDLFLFPNNKDNGALETLLENISLPQHKSIFHCFDSYKNCIAANADYTLPNDKAKIYAYMEALTSRNQHETVKEKKRNFLNTDFWDMNSSYLDELRKFLDPLLKPKA